MFFLEIDLGDDLFELCLNIQIIGVTPRMKFR